jgi:hypothetical protein
MIAELDSLYPFNVVFRRMLDLNFQPDSGKYSNKLRVMGLGW